MTTPITTRASPAKPCPVCSSGSKGCSITADGLHLCRGEPGPNWRRITREPDPVGFHHYRRAGDDSQLRMHRNSKAPPRPPTDWNGETARYAKVITPEQRAALARAIGLPSDAVNVIHGLGWRSADNDEPCWTIPERDAAGHAIGISRRYPDGAKKSLGSRGLTIPSGWAAKSGPVFVPEGASDTIALSFCGLPAVGRPSNLGGINLLTELLRNLDGTRDIIIVGENDKKDNGKWPGRDGAAAVAGKLAQALKRTVKWALPPPGYKDARAWILDAAAGAAETIDWLSIGAEVRAALTAAARTGPAESRFTFINSDTFLAADYRPKWIVPLVVVANQPGVVAGPSKAMKTSVLVDLAVSIATAHPFLGTWGIGQRRRVALVSGESGAHTLQETCLRVLRAKDLNPDLLTGWLRWEFTLPTFSDIDSMIDFAETLGGLNVDVVIIDPVYLALGDVDARNLFEMGRALRVVAELLIKAGQTPILAHHANRLLPIGEPMDLQHLAYSGLEQFARQFILLNRKEPYRNDGIHELWFRIGGSAGHGSLNRLRIEEGTTDEQFRGRRWDVAVQRYADAIRDENARKDAENREKKLQSLQHDQDEIMRVIDDEVKSGRPGATASRIRDRTGISYNRVNTALYRLVEAGALTQDEWMQPGGKNARQRVKGYRRVASDQDGPDLFA